MSDKLSKNNAVLIYSSLIWNNIWSHSHDLAKILGQSVPVYYLEVPKNHAKGHEHLIEKNIHPVPENVSLITPKKTFKTFGPGYFLYTQWFTLKSFIKLHKRIKTVMIYNTYDLLFFMLSKFLGKNTIFMYVDHYEDLTPNKLARWYIRHTTCFFVRHADSVVCTARILEENAKKYNKHVSYLPNAAALEKFARQKKVPQKKFIVGFVGSLGNWVDADMIANSAKELLKYHDIEFCIIGPGPGADHLKKCIEKEQLHNIRLLGFLKHEDSIKKMFSFNVAIIPFKINDITNSVSPVKLFEYWLAGNPVIATKTYELAQFKNELIFADNAHEMSGAILQLRKNPALGKKMALEGKELVLTKYNWDKYAKSYQQMI